MAKWVTTASQIGSHTARAPSSPGMPGADGGGSGSQSARKATAPIPVTPNGSPSPYHVSTYHLAFNATAPKRHHISTHWQKQQPASASSAASAAAPSSANATFGGSQTLPPLSPPSASSASASAAAAAAAPSASSSSASADAYAVLKSTLPPHAFVAAAPVPSAAPKLAAIDGNGGGRANDAVFASGDGSANIPLFARSAGKFHSAKRAYKPAQQTVDETAERLAKENADYRDRGLRFGSSIRNIAFHQPHVEMNLPARFTSPEFFDRPARGQHAAYRTTSNQIGFRPPNNAELTKVYATRPISFTGSFGSGPYRSGGLNTAIQRPRVDTKEGLNV